VDSQAMRGERRWSTWGRVSSTAHSAAAAVFFPPLPVAQQVVSAWRHWSLGVGGVAREELQQRDGTALACEGKE
jgi:hypothetical protein